MSRNPTLLIALPVAIAALTGLSVFCFARVMGPLWDALAARRIAGLRPELQALNIEDAQLGVYLRIWGLAMLGAVFLPWLLLGMPLISLPAVYMVYLAPRILLERQIRQRRSLLRDQLTSASVALANAIRAGMSLAQGLESVGAETPVPLGNEFRRIVNDYRRGRPLAEAIGAIRTRLDLDSFRLFSSALLVSLERGGRVSDTLVRISHSLQENQRLERKLEADTASGRKLILILGIFPVVFLGGMAALDPSGTGDSFRSLPGQVVLLVVMLLIYGAVKMANKILIIEI